MPVLGINAYHGDASACPLVDGRPRRSPRRGAVLPSQAPRDGRDEVPAITHEDGTGRLQMVGQDVNPRYYDLIAAFGRKTGVPMVLNTSFNESEPIVNTPAEAIDCFLRTDIDVLVLGDRVVTRSGEPSPA